MKRATKIKPQKVNMNPFPAHGPDFFLPSKQLWIENVNAGNVTSNKKMLLLIEDHINLIEGTIIKRKGWKEELRHLRAKQKRKIALIKKGYI